MPSFWPFARDDSSPASFEKALSKISAQLTTSTVSLERTRTRAHRSKAFWTLWSTLAYLVYSTIIALVLGPQHWGMPHYAGLAGGPVIIYAVRRLLALIFDWQIARQQGQVDRLIKERDQKIVQLKKATRYDTTQELLNKYGGSTPRSQSGEKQGTKRKAGPSKQGGQQQQFQRTGISPPPTANIPSRSPQQPPPAQQAGSRPSTPSRATFNSNTPQQHLPQSPNSPLSPSISIPDFSPDPPGFAPNAFAPSSSYAPDSHQHRWYDRILDVMLGEDETLAKNRLALICSNCRLVNGQAPPGTRSLEEIGRWRCGGCGGWNGFEKVEGERGVERLVEQIRRRDDAEVEGGWTRVSRGDEHVKTSPSEGKDRRDAKNEDGERDRVVKEEIPDSTDETDDDGDGIANTEDGEADEQKAETVSKPVTRSKRRGGRNTTQKK